MIHFGTQMELQSECLFGQIVLIFFRDMLRHGQIVSKHSLGNEILSKTSERLEY